jgi:hypothetical protein
MFSVSDGNLSDGYFELYFNYDAWGAEQLNQLTSVMNWNLQFLVGSDRLVCLV